MAGLQGSPAPAVTMVQAPQAHPSAQALEQRAWIKFRRLVLPPLRQDLQARPAYLLLWATGGGCAEVRIRRQRRRPLFLHRAWARRVEHLWLLLPAPLLVRHRRRQAALQWGPWASSGCWSSLEMEDAWEAGDQQRQRRPRHRLRAAVAAVAAAAGLQQETTVWFAHRRRRSRTRRCSSNSDNSKNSCSRGRSNRNRSISRKSGRKSSHKCPRWPPCCLRWVTDAVYEMFEQLRRPRKCNRSSRSDKLCHSHSLPGTRSTRKNRRSRKGGNSRSRRLGSEEVGGKTSSHKRRRSRGRPIGGKRAMSTASANGGRTITESRSSGEAGGGEGVRRTRSLHGRHVRQSPLRQSQSCRIRRSPRAQRRRRARPPPLRVDPWTRRRSWHR